MTCNDCGRDINYCDRYGCREVKGRAWDRPPPPDVLVDARQERVHEEGGKVRPASSHKTVEASHTDG